MQIALGFLLATSLLVLAGRSLLQSLQAGSSTLPSQRIDLNSATQAELMLLPGVGETLAERIVKARAVSLFKEIEDLRTIAGIGPATFERLRPWVFVSAGFSPAPREAGLAITVEPSRRPGAKPKKAANLTEPIDVNTADVAQLMQISGIGPVLSKRIIDERAKRPFQTIAELRRVKGIGPKTLEKITPFVTVTPAEDWEP
jgi:competence protein ComEA